MRLYFFGNFYLSSIQQGIQAAHVTAELFIKYTNNQYRNPPLCDLREWAYHHKTMILLNGGMASDLLELEEFLAKHDHDFAWAPFYEETAALNNSITSVGIVLPEYMYVGASDMRERKMNAVQLESSGGILGVGKQCRRYDTFEARLMERMNACKLAS